MYSYFTQLTISYHLQHAPHAGDEQQDFKHYQRGSGVLWVLYVPTKNKALFTLLSAHFEYSSKGHQDLHSADRRSSPLDIKALQTAAFPQVNQSQLWVLLVGSRIIWPKGWCPQRSGWPREQTTKKCYKKQNYLPALNDLLKRIFILS